MLHATKRTLRKQIQIFKRSFLQLEELSFSRALPTERLQQIAEHGSRNRVFSPLTTLKTFLWQVLSDDGSCKEAVASVLAERLSDGMPPNSVNTGPYCKARQRLPLLPLQGAVKDTGANLHRDAQSGWTWHGYNVVMVDGTTVLMPDTSDNQLAFPQQRNQKAGLGFPIARLVALVSLSVGGIIDYALGAYQGKGSGESSLLCQLFSSLSSGDLLLGDRYYCTYAIVALLQAKGCPVVFRNHAQKKSDFRTGTRLGERDHLIVWKKPKRAPVWMSPEEYAELPASLQVREFSVDGVEYVTTLIDAKQHHKKAISALYRERWKVELDLRSIKTDMGMEMLRCQTPEMVQKEIATHLLAYNLIRISMAQAASCHRMHPRTLSVRAAIQLLGKATQLLANAAAQTLERYCSSLLKAICSTTIGKRKRRPQPRAVKRRPKPFPLLMEPREIACQRLSHSKV